MCVLYVFYCELFKVYIGGLLIKNIICVMGLLLCVEEVR